MDPDWIRIWVSIQPKMLDPDPYQMNTDQRTKNKQYLQVTVRRAGRLWTTPSLFSARQLYSPLSWLRGFCTVRRKKSDPSGSWTVWSPSGVTGPPSSRSQVMVGSGMPAATQWRVAGDPRGTVRSTGCSAISGGVAEIRRNVIATLKKTCSTASVADPGSEFFPSWIPDPHQRIEVF